MQEAERFGLEAISRGALKTVFCDKEYNAVNVIKQNIEKTKTTDRTKILKMDYGKALETLKNENAVFDIIFLDPPYESDYIQEIIDKITEYNLLSKDGIIIVETGSNDINIGNKFINMYDKRKYGNIYLIFLNKTT